MCVYVCVSVYRCLCSIIHEGQKTALDPLELELQVLMGYPACYVGAGMQSPVNHDCTPSAVNYWTIVPDPNEPGSFKTCSKKINLQYFVIFHFPCVNVDVYLSVFHNTPQDISKLYYYLDYYLFPQFTKDLGIIWNSTQFYFCYI